MKFSNYGLGIIKGMGVTLKNLFRASPTTQYPEQRLTVSKRIRGTELVWSVEKCTGCATCARTCPQGVIRIVTHPGEAGGDPNRYVVETLEVDSGYCIHCGLCVEACPYNALFLGYKFERAKYRRQELVQSKEDMSISQETPSAYYHPELAGKLPKQTLLIDREKK
ncbi:MAG: NADH-quinone oxidoreductase subunit I [Dehalococcoidales bacterium]|nr:NADH-quinone oxidoreductase subunit I [Dehalococcoidales bacterium]